MENKKRIKDASVLLKSRYEAKNLIDPNELYYRFCKICDEYGNDHIFLDVLCDEINNATIIEAVDVVRCKDCKHFGGHGACHAHAADENGTPIFVRENDFCSYAERKQKESTF